jgi:hypothetical protein
VQNGVHRRTARTTERAIGSSRGGRAWFAAMTAGQ